MASESGRRRLTEAESAALIETYTPLVNSIARSLLRSLPASVAADDLVQDGMLGLLVALLRSTRVREGAHFEHYLGVRIRGAMLDGLRQGDPATRRVRRAMRDVEAMVHRLSQQYGRMPHEGEIAAGLGMPLAAYQHLLAEADGYQLLMIEDFEDVEPGKDFLDWCARTNSDPLAALERKAFQRALLVAISELSGQEDRVMTLYYVEELTMKEIGHQLALSEARISQVHAQAVARLRAAVLGGEAVSPLLKPRWRLP